jgi:hypothetical protein
MAYATYTASYGAGYANTPVIISEVGTGLFATILATTTGGFLNSQGQATLDSSGNLSVVIDTARTWNVALFDGSTFLQDLAVSSKLISSSDIATLSGVPGVHYVLNTAPYNEYMFDGTGLRRMPTGHAPVATITSAQLLALNATPQTIIAAQGANTVIIPLRMMIYKPAGVAYAGIAAGEDLVLKYTNGSGVQCSGVVETTGFLDQTTAQTRYVGMPASIGATAGDVTPATNAAIVLHLLTGEITTGDQPLYVKVWYDVTAPVFTS